MLKAQLKRLRQFMAADVTAAQDRMAAELAVLREELAALRAELAVAQAKDNELAKQMEGALLTIALANREPA